MISLRTALPALAILAAAPALAGEITGEATYRERMMLPPGATFEAVLEDVGRADAPGIPLGKFGPAPASGPPFAYRIRFDDTAVRGPKHFYALRASILHRGRLLFTTTDRITPLATGPGGPIVMRRVPGEPSRQPPPPAAPASSAAEALGTAYWRLTEVNGRRIAGGQPGEAHLRFNVAEGRVAGSGGCNRITGGFSAGPGRIRFRQMAGTMMACPGPAMQTERAFLDALKQVARWRINGDRLTLANGRGRPILRLVAVHMR